MFVSGYVHLSVGTTRGQKTVLDPVELELQAVVSLLMWVLGIQLRSSERARNLWSAGPASSFQFVYS